jgi:uncharacterized protein YjgD (DUF1641 family)
MADPIKYRPHADTGESARDQLEDVLQALADSGALRLAKDVLERLGEVSTVFLDRLETEPGRRAVGNLAVIGAALSQLPPDRLQLVVGAMARGLENAGRLSRAAPPSFLQMLLVLRSASVRRALVAALTILYSLGEMLRPEEASGTPLVRAPR